MLFDYLVNLIESTLFAWFFSMFSDEYEHIKRNTAVFLLISFIFKCSITMLPGSETIGSILLQLMCFIYLSIIAPKQYFRNAVIALIPYTLFGITNILFNFLSSWIADTSHLLLFTSSYYYVHATLAVQILHFIGLFLLQKSLIKSKYISLENIDYILFFSLIICLQFAMIIAGSEFFPKSFFKWENGIIFFPLTAALFIITFIFRSVTIKENLIAEQRLTNQILQGQVDAAEYFRETEVRIRKMLHDLKHLTPMLETIEENSDLAKEYRATADELFLPLHTPSKIFNSLMYQFMIQASKHEIKVQSNLNLSKEIQMNQYDLILLLSNILDNAVVHCGADKKIYIEVSDQDNHLKIHVKNTINISEDSADKRNKTHDLTHGYGILTIKQITEKYSGLCQLNVYKDQFVINVIIPYM